MARKPFVPKNPANEAAIKEAEALDAPVVLTVNGKPIPPEFAHAITYAMTDQGIAEAQKAAERPDGKVYPRASVTSDAWDKTVARKGDGEVWDGFNPLDEAIDQVREKGMNYRFISDRVLNRRGRRGWEPVETPDGKGVVVAGMRLGHMPTERAEKRNQHYRDIANTDLKNAAENYEIDQAKAIRDAKVKGMAPLRVGERLTDNHNHPGMSISAGIHSVRGDEQAA